jgi:putative flippase GtrA
MKLRRKYKKVFKQLFSRKMTLKQKFKDEDFQFVFYVLISNFSSVVFFLLYVLFTYVLTNGNYILANTVAYTVSFTVLYLLDRNLFKAKTRSKKKFLLQATSFIVLRVIGFPLDTGLLYVLVEKVGLGKLMGKLVGSLIMFFFNYLTNKLFVFSIRD